ncbi:MAG: LysE family transporter [Chitinophagaceae bacterium]|nr:LysE family transporter [Chitinophagaceae bacterium]
MWEAVVKGLGLGFFLILSVGPVIFTVIKQSLNNGKEGGLAFVAGVWISDFFLVAIANIFSEWVATLLQFQQVIGYIGSGFLIGMGLYYVFLKKVVIKEVGSPLLRFTKTDFLRIAASGFLINTLNPAILLFWLTSATAFSVTHNLRQRIIIFSISLAINIVADIGKVVLAGRLRDRLTVRNISVINKISGSILVVFGLALLWGAFFYKQ